MRAPRWRGPGRPPGPPPVGDAGVPGMTAGVGRLDLVVFDCAERHPFCLVTAP